MERGGNRRHVSPTSRTHIYTVGAHPQDKINWTKCHTQTHTQNALFEWEWITEHYMFQAASSYFTQQQTNVWLFTWLKKTETIWKDFSQLHNPQISGCRSSGLDKKKHIASLRWQAHLLIFSLKPCLAAIVLCITLYIGTECPSSAHNWYQCHLLIIT